MHREGRWVITKALQEYDCDTGSWNPSCVSESENDHMESRTVKKVAVMNLKLSYTRSTSAREFQSRDIARRKKMLLIYSTASCNHGVSGWHGVENKDKADGPETTSLTSRLFTCTLNSSWMRIEIRAEKQLMSRWQCKRGIRNLNDSDTTRNVYPKGVICETAARTCQEQHERITTHLSLVLLLKLMDTFFTHPKSYSSKPQSTTIS